MADDEPGSQPTGSDADQPGSRVQRAIAWLSTDQSRTRQSIEQQNGPIAPGNLLESARFDVQVDRLLTGEGTEQAHALVQAQAGWLIRRMPPEHNPPSLDSAQQAGRAWGLLIAADTQVMPDQEVLTEVSRRTGISMRAADEILAQAHSVMAAFNRADLLIPYDDAKNAVLIGDWNQLAACGPELPEAAERAQDVLELLTARVTGEDYSWMDATAQRAAQVYDSVMQAQPLLASVAALIPNRDQPDAAAEQARLVELDELGLLTTAATAAARARAVQEWAESNKGTEPDRTRKVEAAAPGARTLVRLNESLADLDPDGQPSFTALDPERVAQIVEAIGRLSAEVRSAFRTTSSTLPAATVEHRIPQQHQHPPSTGQSPGGAGPRAAP